MPIPAAVESRPAVSDKKTSTADTNPKTDAKRRAKKFKSDVKPIWCPGCGDFGVLSSFYQALVELEVDSKNLVISSGIGCAGRFNHFVKCYAFHGVHGRALPVAFGMKAANPQLEVFVIGGDGDGLGIGGGHIPHIARRNPDLAYIILDNETYGLTKGQVSPTSILSQVTPTTPYGSVEPPLNPIAMFLSYGVSFVARGFAGDPKQLKQLIVEGAKHKGFAIIHTLSPCPTFNKIMTFKSVEPKIEQIPENYDNTDRLKAMELAMDDETIYTGVFYKNQQPTFTDRAKSIEDKADADHKTQLVDIFKRYR